MKFRSVSKETRLNYLLWSIKKEISRENKYLSTLGYDPMPIIDVVKHYIDKWDPIELLAMDGPTDEYDGETQTVSIYITMHAEKIDAESLSKAINKIFSDAFKAEFSKAYESIEIAQNIIDLLRLRNLIN